MVLSRQSSGEGQIWAPSEGGANRDMWGDSGRNIRPRTQPNRSSRREGSGRGPAVRASSTVTFRERQRPGPETGRGRPAGQLGLVG